MAEQQPSTVSTEWERRHNAGQRAELVNDLLEALERRHNEVHDQRARTTGWLVPADAPAQTKLNAAHLDGQLEELGEILMTVRGMRRDRVEYYDFDIANRRATPHQAHRDHLAHVDVCAICRQEDHDTRVARHLTERVERLRALLAVTAIRLTQTRTGDAPPTPAQAAKALKAAARQIHAELEWLEPSPAPAAKPEPPRGQVEEDQPALFDTLTKENTDV